MAYDAPCGGMVRRACGGIGRYARPAVPSVAGTRYVSMRGLTGSRRVCAAHVARRPVRACVATPVRLWRPMAYDEPCGGSGRYAFGGLWPMVRRVAVAGATRALWMVRRVAVASATRALRCL
eukprot:5937034-Prymnesium_polylepis.1